MSYTPVPAGTKPPFYGSQAGQTRVYMSSTATPPSGNAALADQFAQRARASSSTKRRKK